MTSFGFDGPFHAVKTFSRINWELRQAIIRKPIKDRRHSVRGNVRASSHPITMAERSAVVALYIVHSPFRSINPVVVPIAQFLFVRYHRVSGLAFHCFSKAYRVHYAAVRLSRTDNVTNDSFGRTAVDFLPILFGSIWNTNDERKYQIIVFGCRNVFTLFSNVFTRCIFNGHTTFTKLPTHKITVTRNTKLGTTYTCKYLEKTKTLLSSNISRDQSICFDKCLKQNVF